MLLIAHSKSHGKNTYGAVFIGSSGKEIFTGIVSFSILRRLSQFSFSSQAGKV
jgi:hypothetical protein